MPICSVVKACLEPSMFFEPRITTLGGHLSENTPLVGSRLQHEYVSLDSLSLSSAEVWTFVVQIRCAKWVQMQSRMIPCACTHIVKRVLRTGQVTRSKFGRAVRLGDPESSTGTRQYCVFIRSHTEMSGRSSFTWYTCTGTKNYTRYPNPSQLAAFAYRWRDFEFKR